ncbi:MAG: hypothetical protein D6718_08230 [Acidobacteria bacterium]|nr:MAG: hypothetical protein D6718_08230 [Acidobacteriota bacterium]
MNALRVTLAVAGRELRAYFLQPLAWIVLTTMLLVEGLNFWYVIALSNGAGASFVEVARLLFSSLLFWLPLLVAIPVAAMRLIAEERQSGTLEALLTAPVTEGQVAVGKFLGAYAFFLVLLAPLLVDLVLLDTYGEVDWRAAAAGFLSLALTGAYLLAAAMCASALSRSAIVAAITGFILVMALFVTPYLGARLTEGTDWFRFWDQLDLLTALDEMARGIVKSNRIVYPVTGTAALLFACARLIELVKGR